MKCSDAFGAVIWSSVGCFALSQCCDHREGAEAPQELSGGGTPTEDPRGSPAKVSNENINPYPANTHPYPANTHPILLISILFLFHCSFNHSNKTPADTCSKLRAQKACYWWSWERRTVQALCYKPKKSNGHPCSKHPSQQLGIQLNKAWNQATQRHPNQTAAPQGFQMWCQCRAGNQTPQTGKEVLQQNTVICHSGIP